MSALLFCTCSATAGTCSWERHARADGVRGGHGDAAGRVHHHRPEAEAGVRAEPAAAARFSDTVAALVMDSAPRARAGDGRRVLPFGATGSRASLGKGASLECLNEGVKTFGTSENAFARPPRRRRRLAPHREALDVDAAWGGFGGGDRERVERRPQIAPRERRGGGARRRGRRSCGGSRRRRSRCATSRRGDARGDGSRRRRESRTARARPGTTESMIENGGLLRCPALFLYSAADALIPPEGVEAFAAARARRLGTVSSASTEGAGAGASRLRRWKAPRTAKSEGSPGGVRRGAARLGGTRPTTGAPRRRPNPARRGEHQAVRSPRGRPETCGGARRRRGGRRDDRAIGSRRRRKRGDTTKLDEIGRNWTIGRLRIGSLRRFETYEPTSPAGETRSVY